MNIIEINRMSNNHDGYYGSVKLSYDEIVMISNALHKYNKSTESDTAKQQSLILKNKWNDFRDMVCYGKIDHINENNYCNHAWREDEDLYRDDVGKLHKMYKCIKCGATRVDCAWQ